MLTYNFLLLIFAGLINSSFVIPIRYINHLTHNKIWLSYSIIGIALLPWLIYICCFPAINHYFILQPLLLIIIAIGGSIFGLGQICFLSAIERIGIALSFLINLSIGVTVGLLFVIFYKAAVLTSKEYEVIFAILLIILSLLIYYFANKQTNYISKEKNYQHGWCMAALAGVASGIQNITFIIVMSFDPIPFNNQNAFWVWPPFLLAASIPMILGFYIKVKHENSQSFFDDNKIAQIKNILLISIMGVCFNGSLLLYSIAMSQLPTRAQIIGWPCFMIAIILGSQVWGFIYKEFQCLSKAKKGLCIVSMAILFAALIILSIAQASQ